MKLHFIQYCLGIICLVSISRGVSGQCAEIALLDSSFESGVFDVDGRTGWFRSDGGSFEQNAYHGMLSACSNAGGLWQIVPVQPQTTYYLSCYVKNQWADVYQLYAGGTEYIDSTVASDWTFISMPFSSGQDTSITLGYFTEGSVCFDFMRLTCDPISGLDRGSYSLEFSLFPNPANNRITLSFGKPFTGYASLHNSMGQRITSHNLARSQQIEWDISHLPEGVYNLRVRSRGKSVSRKVVKRD